jgi:hypothetical protein
LEICQEYTWEKSAKKIAAIYSLFVWIYIYYIV